MLLGLGSWSGEMQLNIYKQFSFILLCLALVCALCLSYNSCFINGNLLFCFSSSLPLPSKSGKKVDILHKSHYTITIFLLESQSAALPCCLCPHLYITDDLSRSVSVWEECIIMLQSQDPKITLFSEDNRYTDSTSHALKWCAAMHFK